MGFDYDLFKIGTQAEITVLDPNVKWTFTKHDIFSKSKNSPFVGKEMNGKIIAEQIGAQIFIDGWGMIAAGDPDFEKSLNNLPYCFKVKFTLNFFS